MSKNDQRAGNGRHNAAASSSRGGPSDKGARARRCSRMRSRSPNLDRGRAYQVALEVLWSLWVPFGCRSGFCTVVPFSVITVGDFSVMFYSTPV
jgi:hypothetical protein